MGDDLEENFELELPEEQQQESTESLKKRKDIQTETPKAKKQKVQEESKEESIASLDAEQQAKYFKSKFDAAFPGELSSLESEKELQGCSFYLTNR